ncbi:MAG: STAS domain-containing protein [bacterium]|nr:STAS domain-containing protein [bacterium]
MALRASSYADRPRDFSRGSATFLLDSEIRANGSGKFVLQHDPLPLDIRIEKHGPAMVLIISGQIDLYNDGELEEELNRLFEQGHRRLVLDMADVPFVDSAGFGLLIAAQKRFHAVDGHIFYTNVPKNVEAVVKLSKLQNFITIFNTRAEAVAAFPPPHES